MRKICLSFFVLLFCTCILKGQQTNKLPRNTPEAEGVSSVAIISFLDALEKSNNEPHSIMLLRHGKVIAEGWWKPYSPEQLHNVYSVSKSFTATAVGFAEAEKLLHLDDKVISYFPNDLPDTVSDNLHQLRIRDLLTMCAGMESVPPVSDDKSDSWVKIFFAHPILHKPGTRFLYNPMATYMLSAIVQKVTGTTTYDYLNRKLFSVIGIRDADFTISPEGITCGGWGLRLKTEDMARFGQFYLQKGSWSGKQLLSAEWVQQATSAHIIQHPDLSGATKDTNDWEQGYGYQLWRGLHNTWRADGSWGQYILIMPDQDAVLVITEEALNLQKTLNLVWQYLLPAFKEQALPQNDPAAHMLRKRLTTLKMPAPRDSSFFSGKMKPAHRVYSISDNDIKISKITLQLNGKRCDLTVTKDSINFDFRFASGRWMTGASKVRGMGHPAYFYTKLKEEAPSKVAGTFYWVTPDSLKLILQYTQSQFKEFINRETITLTFEGDKVSMNIDDNRGWKVKCSGNQFSY